MRKRLTPLIAASLLASSVFLAAHAQERRGVGVSAARSSAGGYYALVIGNNEYRSLPRLRTAEADARAVAALLRDTYGFETRLLLNATRGQIISAFSAYRRALGPEANLLVYYAGHGYNDRDADKAYWLPVDAERDDTSNWIIADEITTALKVSPARHVLVVSDSCYSGALTRDVEATVSTPAARERYLQKMLVNRSRTLMASGGNEPVADGGGEGHSIFAGAFLRGLRGMDRDTFTAEELFFNFVRERVAGRSEQTPEYNPLRNSGHDGGDFVFMKRGPAAAEEMMPPPRPAAPANTRPRPAGLNGLTVKLIYIARREADAMKLASRLRGLGAKVLLDMTSDGGNEPYVGKVFAIEGYEEAGRRVALAVADVEQVELGSVVATATEGQQLNLWVARVKR